MNKYKTTSWTKTRKKFVVEERKEDEKKILEDLGLESDVIEKIMSEAGKDTTALKAKVDDLTERLTVKETTISEKEQ